MEYRKTRIADFLAISALDREAWGDNRNSEYIADGEHAWRIWAEHADMYCAVDEAGHVVGAILAFPTVAGAYCLHKVFVSKAERGQGIGSGLFCALMKDIDEKRAAVFLTVDPENASAIALYEKWGFAEREYVAGYYRDNEPRYVLTRPARR